MADLVKATVRLGNTQGCQRLLAMMREGGVAADVELYDALLRLSNTRYFYDLSISLLNDMEKDGIKPTEPMLSATLHTCIQTSVSGGLAMVGAVSRAGGVAVMDVLTTLLSMYGMTWQRPGEALNVLGRYHRNGLKPSLPALGSFIRFLSEVKEVTGLRKGE